MESISEFGTWARYLAYLAGGLAAVALAASATAADDTSPLERVATIVSKGKAGTLDHLLVDSESSPLFLANQSNDTLDVIDVKNNRLLKQIPNQASIHSIAYAPSLGRLFVGNGAGSCNVLDAASYEPITSIPVPGADSVRFDPRTSHAFVAGDNSLTVIDAKTGKSIAAIKVPGAPHGFQVARNSPKVFVNATAPPQVIVVDTDKNEVVSSIPVPVESKGIGPLAMDEANGRIFVGLRSAPQLLVLDILSGKQVATVPIPEGADDLFYDALSKRIYITSSAGNITVIQQGDSNHYERVANMVTATGAKTSFYDPVLKRLYVAVPRLADSANPEIWVYAERK